MSAKPLDAFAVLRRADGRWASRTKDDPAPDAYLRHLVAALQPLLEPGAAPVDLDQAAELESAREQITQLELDVGELTSQRDLANREWSATLAKLDQAGTELNQLRLEVAETRAERDTARGELADLQHEQAQMADQIATIQSERDGARDQHAAVLEHLGRLVDAVNEEWHPDGDLAAQVDRAVQLVAAAVDQLLQHANAGKHVCAWPRDPSTGRIGKCACGKPMPKTVQAGLAGAIAKKGDAA